MPDKMVEVKIPQPSPRDTDVALLRMLVTLAAYKEKDPSLRMHLLTLVRSRDFVEIGIRAETLRTLLDNQL